MALSKMDLNAQVQATATIKVPRKPLCYESPGKDTKEFFERDFLLDLRRFLAEQEGCEIEVRTQCNAFSETTSLSALGSDSPTTCMLRMFNRAQIIVKYVILEHQRIGTLTEIVRRLCLRAQDWDISTLVVESVLTPEMKQWCVKYGMSVDPSSGDSVDGLGLSYMIQVSEMLNRLQSK